MNKVVAVFIFKNSDQADRTLNFLWSKLSGGFERSAGSEVWIRYLLWITSMMLR